MDTKYIRERLSLIEASDCNHEKFMIETYLYHEFVRFVADYGNLELAELANECLKAESMDFERWFS